MATRFLKVDCSPGARDFEQVALEPGVPLLDRNGAHYRTLKKWLGRWIAEPEWDGTDLSFFVSDETGARPHDVRCEPASPQDRAGVKSLRDDFEAMKRRLQEAKPEAKEAKLHQAIVRHFNAAITSAGPKQSEHHFFRYLDGGTWRLVWCWGYQRKDLQPASAIICTNPACRLLFVRRPDGTRDCPACASEVVAPPAPRRSRKTKYVLGLVILALVAAGLGYVARDWMKKGPAVAPPSAEGLVASPTTWTGPAGSQLEYEVLRVTKDGAREIVSTRVVPISENPKIVRVEKGGAKIRARSTGKTAVHFYLGDQHTHATVEVEPPKNPPAIKLVPAEVTLGVGSIVRLRVEADGDEKQSIDLTDMAEWESVTSASVSCHAGQIEGLSPGEATIVVRYRATPTDPYLTAEARIKVVDEKYTKLEVGVLPSTITEKGFAELTVSVFNEAGEKRSALGSSLLSLSVSPAGLANIDGEHLQGIQVGRGTVFATFDNLTASSEFTVENDPSNRFIVSPKDLQLLVGELAELQIASSSDESIRVVSSAPAIVAVESAAKVMGKSPGKAELTVTQGAREAKVEVVVTAPDIKSIAFEPSRISVPVDRSVPVRIVGYTNDDQQFELAAEAITWEEMPQAAMVELDVKKLELLGRQPTGDSPQIMVARFGDLRARGEVDVVAGPLQIELTPTDPVDLPVGQITQLRAWARYGDGTRTEIDPGRLEWRVDPADSTELTFDKSTATVSAIKGGSALTVVAMYHGFESNRVEVRGTDQDLTIAIRADDSLILVGDQGRFHATASNSPADFSLVSTQFESSHPELLAVESNTGVYRALAAGKVKVTARHPNAKTPAEAEFEIVARDNAQLVIRPATITLLVNGRQPLELILVAGQNEEQISLAGDFSQTRMSIAHPDVVEWQPPMLRGVKAHEPFEITVEHAGKMARGMVEVVAGEGDIRVSPNRIRLSPGQALSPQLEQKVAGTEQWQEIDPVVVVWKIPDSIRWTPAQGQLRPQLTPSESAQGTLALEASYAGKTASLEIEVVNEPPPKGELLVVREPEGDDVPVDSQQRYALVVQQGDQQIPAADVKWQPAFENEYVSWEPPVLHAKLPGHEQVLSASGGEEKISFIARTTPRFDTPLERPSPRSEQPAELRIVAEQPSPIVIPVGARFSSFRVEAVYGDSPAVDVTRDALLRVIAESPSSSPIAVVDNEVVGQRPGQAELRAEFNGVTTPEGLRFEVAEKVELTAIAVSPSTVRLEVGEMVTVRVTGSTGSGDQRRTIGDISSLPDLAWRGDPPDIVRGDGPTLTGLTIGQAKLTVTVGAASADIDVEVVGPGTIGVENIVISPRMLRLKVGESKRLGSDVTVHRGELDLADQLEAESSAPDIVRFNPDNRSLEGISPGRADVAITAGGHIVSLPVLVEQSAVPDQGTLVIEPFSGALVVGEYMNLRVFLVSDLGQRIDRTGSASFESSDQAVVSTVRSRITGISPGEATITARLTGIAEPGQATFSVVTDTITALQVIPSPISLSVGERKSLRIEGIGAKGRRPLGDHPEVQIVATSETPGVVELNGSEIRGVSPGKATLQVSWQGLDASPVAVNVTNDPITGLRVDSPEIHVAVNDRVRLSVFARRGDSEILVTADDNLRILVTDSSIAEVERDLSLRGISPGATTVTAQLGSQRAAAQLIVVPAPLDGAGRDFTANMSPGLRFIPDVLTMQLGVPAGSVRLVKVSADGSIEDLNQQATIEISPEAGKNVVDVNWTNSGPVVVAKKAGRAEVNAILGDLTTRTPLSVVVVDEPLDSSVPARLEVRPDPLQLAVGKIGDFRRVQLIPSRGEPIDVDYRVESKNAAVVSVDGDRQIRGMSTGLAQVVVRPAGVPPQWAEVTAEVTVNVEPATPPLSEDSRLVLRGPSRAIVGAPVSFRVELAGLEATQDITHEGAALVLEADQAVTTELRPGCVLVPKQAMTLSVRARYKNLVSNVVNVAVAPVARNFVKLEIEIDRAPMTIDERRPYILWGHPSGGGPRQDVTHQVQLVQPSSDGPTGPVVRVAPQKGFDASIVTHLPPSVLAKAPGAFVMRADYGAIKSPVIELQISDAPLTNVRLFADLPSVTIGVGQRTPPIRAIATTPDGRQARSVAATWRSENDTVVAADPDSPGQFVGKSPGQTRLKATFSNQETTVDVTVTGEAFEKVTINEKPNLMPGNYFLVSISIQASNQAESPLEYRVSTVVESKASNWKAAPTGAQQQFILVSPPLKRGPDDTKYHLMIEARDKQQHVVARYPLSFRLNITTIPTVETKE